MGVASRALPNKPSFVTYGKANFLIFDAPTDENLDLYLDEMRKHGCTHMVRVCDPTYNEAPVQATGIEVHDWPFADGEPPPEDIIEQWLHLCQQTFSSNGAGKQQAAVGVHCVAGLGRAPLLVAIALVARGIEWSQAVEMIRERRRGALNARQLNFLESFEPPKESGKCTVM